jgi:hypothetical protein
MNDRPVISPDLKIGALLEAYPELEEVLITAAPAFAKLRNPVLRRTVARVTTLRQAARVGDLSLGELIGRLRRAAGCPDEWQAEPEDVQEVRPTWLDSISVKDEYDARAEIEGGGHPLPVVLAALKQLQPGEGYALVTPFTPAPLIDRARQLGFRSWTEERGPEDFLTTFSAP